MTPRELLRWRDKYALSQAKLAELLDVHYNTVANWETGRTPMPHMADLAMETIAGQRAMLQKSLARRKAELQHQRQLKAIAQGVDLSRPGPRLAVAP